LIRASTFNVTKSLVLGSLKCEGKNHSDTRSIKEVVALDVKTYAEELKSIEIHASIKKKRVTAILPIAKSKTGQL
jgi:hypothetical protein